MKLTKILLVLVLVAPIAFGPLNASAAQGLTLLVFATPSGQDVGDTVDFAIESYMWGDLTDVNILEIRAGSSTGPMIPTANVSTGKYEAHFVIDAANVSSYGTVTFYYKALVGGVSSSYSESYSVGAGAATAYPDWTLTLRAMGGESPRPGDTVSFEARTYLDGMLAEGGKVNATVTYASGLSVKTDDLTTTKASDGVYTFTYTAPASLATSASYTVEAQLGPGLLDPYDSVALLVDPIPVLITYESVTSSSATIKVIAGGDGSGAGATVTMEGSGFDFSTFDIITAGPFTATADAQGVASVPVTWDSSASLLTWTLTVEQGGKKTLQSLTSFSSGTWAPSPNSAFGCQATLQSDPSQFRAGTTAQLKFRITEDGVALPNIAMARFVWKTGGTTATVAGNASTDGSANMTVSFAIPNDFGRSDIAYFYIVCPKGGADEVHVTFPDLDGSMSSGSPDLTVTATTASTGRNITVSAVYSGSMGAGGTYAWAELVPSSGVPSPYSTGTLRADLMGSSSTYSGTLVVPDWYPGGSYKVVVHLSNMGASDNRDTESSAMKTQSVQVAAPEAGGTGGDGGDGGGSGGGFLPGFEVLAALGACGVAVVGASRRRRSG